MTNADARAYVEALGVSRETLARLDQLAELVIRENKSQNLIAAGTEEIIWSRHIADSVQLIQNAPKDGMWLDIGSGAGFPGLVVAAAAMRAVTLVEERAKRAAFLRDASAALSLSDLVTVRRSRIEHVRDVVAPRVISARAVASLTRLFSAACHISDSSTIWLLPKGRTAQSELAAARTTWQGTFRLVPSITDRESAIVVATNVRARVSR